MNSMSGSLASTLDRTYGAPVLQGYTSLSPSLTPLRRAWEVVGSLQNHALASSAARVLRWLELLLQLLNGSGDLDSARLPSLLAYSPDNGSVVFEWATENMRAGFTIDSDPLDSGWYIVSTKNANDFMASGFFDESNEESILLWLLAEVIRNT